MPHRVCPWWLGYVLTWPLVRHGQNPHEILAPHVRKSWTVLEPGPGMGFFTLELARLVGPSGRVIAVDIQPKMLDRLRRRALKAGLLDRIDIRTASSESMGVADLKGSADRIQQGQGLLGKFIYDDKLAGDLKTRVDAVRGGDPSHPITSHAAVPGLFTSPTDGYGEPDDWKMAEAADEVYFTASGIPVKIK